MATIWIDGVAHEVEAGRNLLETSLSLGLDLPYFCWHPSLGSVGACRQCAVVQYQDENDTRGRIVMGCMTAVADGARFSLGGDRASDFRRGVVETLMINHPHDCPVCSEGGECHLQDMTVMTGHRDRRFRGRKRTFRNQYLGPLVHHEMNRCITCYRCTRYYRDYAGGTDLAALASRDRVYFGREADGVLESEFAGNLVEVCPTGVFTDRTLLGDYTRKWDLQSAPSVCGGCAVGCNTFPGERYGRLKRVHNRFNAAVNGYFLCDRGRFGHGWVNDPARLDFPAQRLDDGRFDAVSGERALALAGEALAAGTVAAIGSPRASLESNFLLRELAGAGNCAPGVAVAEQPLLQRALAHLQAGPAATPDIAAIEAADAVLILGEDVTASAPRLALALRQSVRNAAYERAAAAGIKPWQDDAVRNLAQDLRSPLYIAHPGGTRLDDVATAHVSLAPGNLAAFGEAVAAALAGLPLPAVPPALAERAAEVAGALAGRSGRWSSPAPPSARRPSSMPRRPWPPRSVTAVPRRSCRCWCPRRTAWGRRSSTAPPRRTSTACAGAPRPVSSTRCWCSKTTSTAAARRRPSMRCSRPSAGSSSSTPSTAPPPRRRTWCWPRRASSRARARW